MDEVPYEVSGTEKVKNLEEDLICEINELKNEVDENEMVHGITRPVCTVPLPKDSLHFRRERQMVINRTLEVCQAKPIISQAELMQEELDISLRSDYTPESLPLLLHQHFIDRIQQLVNCKHLHLLRWSRFHEHSSTLESLYGPFQDRLGYIMSEYNDCLARAQRLSASRESYLAGNNNAMFLVKPDDAVIYLRWLICHLHSMKMFNQFMLVLQWLPVVHKSDCNPVAKESKQANESNGPKLPSKYQDENFSSRSRASTHRTSVPTTSSSDTPFESLKPPPISPLILSSNALPSDQLALALAASGGGPSSDEDSLGIPLNVNDLHILRPHLTHMLHLYDIQVNIEEMRTSADEMELYGYVSRKFRQCFTRQEHFNTFKTYDKTDIGQENWGVDHCMHALKQQSNWLDFVQLKPEKDPRHEKRMNELRLAKKVDELLGALSKFFCIPDADKIQDSLREHALVVRDPPILQASEAALPHKRQSCTEMWKKIYVNPELFTQEEKPVDIALQEMEEKEGGKKSSTASAKKRRDSYDYFDAVQLLGLDEGDQDSNDPASIQGAYLSFLHLRHLRVRDLKRTSLSVLNYFRSVERTLTINDGGLSLENCHVKSSSPQNHRRNVVDGTQGGGGGIGSHQYMHNTPRDYKISESEFMQYSEIENHDDFYTTEEGRVHVQDQRGYYIMYDTAVQDLQSLEEDLLLVTSHYIEKDKDLRRVQSSRFSASHQKNKGMSAGDFDIASYGHQEVDRFAVLLDMWTHETAYLECKKELLDCYMEAYHHVFDRDERRDLAQTITNLLYQRPRFDLQSNYFVRCYRLECMCLRSRMQLTKALLDKQISEQREYVAKVCATGVQYGLPHKVLNKHPISVNMSRSALKNIFMLEFHPSLACIGRISQALKQSYWELYHQYQPETVADSIVLEKKMLDCAIGDWEKMLKPGSHFSQATQKEVFSENYIEDPLFMTGVVEKLLKEQESHVSRLTHQEKQEAQMKLIGGVLEMVSARHRLINACSETEILSKVYQRQASSMGYDDCHMFVRFVQFEFAKHKKSAGNPPPVFITSVQEDDSMLDRYTPNCLCLAVHELDESHVGRFNFTDEGIHALLQGSGVQSLQAVLMAQIVHKNALVSAVQQAHLCQPVKAADFAKSGRPSSPIDTKSEKSSTTVMTGFSSGTGGTAMAAKLSSEHQRQTNAPEAFMSMQLEKAPSRDLMLNEFISKKNAMAAVLRNPAQMEELKRKLIVEFCERFQKRVAQYSLRGQILAYYTSMMNLLEDFQEVRDKYFTIGEPQERKSAKDSLEGLKLDANGVHERPRRVMSEDGLHVLNIHFVPHFSEVLIMYKLQDDERCCTSLAYHLRIVAALHDIVQYLCAHARFGSSLCRLGSKRLNVISADWGGTEGIGAELHEVQRQIDHLERKRSPEAVARFLGLRRDVMFLEFDAAVRHSMRDTFLATNNKGAFDAITGCMHFSLQELSNAQKPGYNAVYLNVPEPMEARDPKAWVLCPWRAFINKNGLFALSIHQCRQIEFQMQLCLSALNDVDRHVANAEILGVSLLMEDVLLSGKQDRALHLAYDQSEAASVKSSSQSRSETPRPQKQVDLVGDHKISRTQRPMEAYSLMKSFLLLWKRVEVLKGNWAKSKLIVQSIDTPKLYKAFCIEFKKDILLPILQSVARRLDQTELYEGLISDDSGVMVIPKGASEIEIKLRQLMKLLENLECSMINEVRKKISRELNLVLSERSREESALPTDLWKKPVMKESFTINKPHIAEDFIANLMKDASKTGDGSESSISFSAAHLNSCLSQLAGDVMRREKHNFESYSMYYENLLRTHHQLLYHREQEIKSLKDQIKLLKAHQQVEVQCCVADKNQSLLMEVTALRAKISEMREMSLTQERDVRERVKEEYDGLVQNLFSTCFDIKKKFDEFKEDMHTDIVGEVEEAKNEAKRLMRQAKYRKGSTAEAEERFREGMHNDSIQGLHLHNSQLNILLLKMKALGQWKYNHHAAIHNRTVADLRHDSERSHKDLTKFRMLHSKEMMLLTDQLTALRSALKLSEKECDDVKRDLDKELKAKKEKAHTTQQRAQSQKQVEEARRANIDKLLEELDDKEGLLRALNSEQEKTTRMSQLTTNKTKNEMDSIRKQLSHERLLKLDAFHRVDELQTQVYDIESGIFGSRPQTALSSARPKSVSRAISADGRRTNSRGSSASNWPPGVYVRTIQQRAITPGPDLFSSVNHNELDAKKLARPKSVTSRLRSRLSDQLLHDIEPPDHHQTVIKLSSMQTTQQMKENKVF